MGFITDKQTLEDLNILGSNHSISAIYNLAQTKGGALLLEEMFKYPLDSFEKIENRVRIIKFFYQKEINFPFDSGIFNSVEYYLSNTDTRTQINAEESKALHVKLQRLVKTDNEYQQQYNGIVGLISIINTLKKFLIENKSELLQLNVNEIKAVEEIINGEEFLFTEEEKDKKKIPIERISLYDKKFRYDYRGKVLKILSFIYLIDVYISVAQIALKKGFCFPVAKQTEDNTLSIKGLFHPLLTNPVPNTVNIDDKNNIIFLTGANMAGKSTFMKSFGIAIYLAHLGFPVPATEMTFSVRNGMYSTINLPDNINQGYSHFYAEVLRLKKVAETINHCGNIIVIFDELFRGTNVKDAYDATIAITEAFASHKNSIFIISTHIIESGEILKDRCDNIRFLYLPTIMENNGTTSYPYTIEEGITCDRHGMMIINNEGILDILA